MANSPAIEYFIAQIANLQKLIDNIDGVQPILISIGEYKLPVDPIEFPPAYQAGAAVIRSVALGAINDYKNHISDTILAEALSAEETPVEPSAPKTIAANIVENTDVAGIVAKLSPDEAPPVEPTE